MIVRSVELWFKNKQGKPHGLARPMVTRAVASRLHFLGYVQAFQNSGSTGRRRLGPENFSLEQEVQGFRPLSSIDGV